MKKKLPKFEFCHVAWLHFNSPLVQKPHCTPRVAYGGHAAQQLRGNSSHNNPKEVPRGTPEIKHFVLFVLKSRNIPEVSAGHVYLQIGNIIVTQVEFSNRLSMIFNLPLPQE